MNYKGLAKSLLFALLCLAAVTVVNFFLPRLMPGDPVMILLGSDDSEITQEEYDYYYGKLGLDKPTGEQFRIYLKNLFKGDMGYSYHYGRDVAEVLNEKIPVTLQVALPALIISAFLAYFLGTRAGYKRVGAGDSLLTGGMVVVNTVPTFLLSIIMIIVFAYELHILPYGGLNSVFKPEEPFLAFLDRLKHLILPVATLVIASTPSKYLMVRNTTARAVDEKYVIYARARGLSPRRVMSKHIFKNTNQPFITMIGIGFGKMLSGSIIVETLFSLNGMGLLVFRAISQRDFVVLQGALFIIAVMVIFANLLTDIFCVLADPKQRLGEAYEN